MSRVGAPCQRQKTRAQRHLALALGPPLALAPPISLERLQLGALGLYFELQGPPDLAVLPGQSLSQSVGQSVGQNVRSRCAGKTFHRH